MAIAASLNVSVLVINMLEGEQAKLRDQLLSPDFLSLSFLRMKELIPINPNRGTGYRST